MHRGSRWVCLLLMFSIQLAGGKEGRAAAKAPEADQPAVLVDSQLTSKGLACTYRQASLTFTRITKKSACPASAVATADAPIAGMAASAVRTSSATALTLKAIRQSDYKALSVGDIEAALSAALGHRSSPSSSSAGTSASLTPAKTYKSKFAALGAMSALSVYAGPAGDVFLGNPHMTFASTAQIVNSALQISVLVRAQGVYVFDVSVAPVQMQTTRKGTFVVNGWGKAAAAVPQQTDTVTIPAFGASAKAVSHLGFILIASGDGEVQLTLQSPDSSWNLIRCDISSRKQ